MCLSYSEEQTSLLIERFKKNKKTFVIYYKTVKYNHHLKCVNSTIYNHKWRGGWNYADKTPYKEEQLKSRQMLEYGIHVFTTKEKAMDCQCTTIDSLLPVKCYIKDLVGVSHKYMHEALFTKVWVDKAELDKIRKKYE